MTRASAVLCLAALLLLVACGGGGSSSTPTPVSVTIAPATPTTIMVTHSQTFTATVTGSGNSAVTWSLQEGATAGAITSAGVYTAGLNAGTFHVVATSQADAGKSASVAVTVTAPQPVFSGTPPTSASEGAVYSYSIEATDPAGTKVTLGLTAAPAGATLNGTTLTWAPSSSQSRLAQAFTITATTEAKATATLSWTVSPSGTIRITRINTWVGETQEQTVPYDATGETVLAHVPDGHGGFTTLTGSGGVGEYVISEVPAGHYWLQNDNSFVWTDSSSVDAGAVIMGRPDMQLASSGTGVSLTAATTEAPDHFQIYVPNTGALAEMVLNFTGLTNILRDWTNLPLADATQGDQLWLTKLTPVQLGSGLSFHVLSSFVTPVAFTMTDGANNAIGGTFNALPLDHYAYVNIKASQFAALAAQVNPGAALGTTTAFLSAQPMSGSHGSFTSNPHMLAYYGDAGPLTVDMDLGLVGFGDPFFTYSTGSWWPLVAEYTQMYNIPFTAPGATLSATLTTPARFLSADGNPVYPLVSPPAAPQINGKNFFQNQSGVGTNPVLSWTAPPGATGYHIVVDELQVGFGGSTTWRIAGLLDTTATSIQVPPGVLTSGSSYFFIVQAHAEPDTDFSLAPHRHALPHGMAPIVSGMMTP